MLPSQNNKIMFANTVKSDGFTVDFVINKRTTKDTSLAANVDLAPEDFDLKEVKQTYQPMFLGPGRKSVFTAAIGLDTTNHQIRRCSTAKYYHMTGSTKYIKKLEKLKTEKGIKDIENNITSAKTAECATYLPYIEYILIHVGTLFTFYHYKTAKGRFFMYQGRQRAAEEIVRKERREIGRKKKKEKQEENIDMFRRREETSCQK